MAFQNDIERADIDSIDIPEEEDPYNSFDDSDSDGDVQPPAYTTSQGSNRPQAMTSPNSNSTGLRRQKMEGVTDVDVGVDKAGQPDSKSSQQTHTPSPGARSNFIKPNFGTPSSRSSWDQANTSPTHTSPSEKQIRDAGSNVLAPTSPSAADQFKRTAVVGENTQQTKQQASADASLAKDGPEARDSGLAHRKSRRRVKTPSPSYRSPQSSSQPSNSQTEVPNSQANPASQSSVQSPAADSSAGQAEETGDNPQGIVMSQQPESDALHVQLIEGAKKQFTEKKILGVLVALGIVFMIAGAAVRERPSDKTDSPDYSLGITFATLGSAIWVNVLVWVIMMSLHGAFDKFSPIFIGKEPYNVQKSKGKVLALLLLAITCFWACIYGASLVRDNNSGLPLFGAALHIMAWVCTWPATLLVGRQWWLGVHKEGLLPPSASPNDEEASTIPTNSQTEGKPVDRLLHWSFFPRVKIMIAVCHFVCMVALLSTVLAGIYVVDSSTLAQQRGWRSDVQAYTLFVLELLGLTFQGSFLLLGYSRFPLVYEFPLARFRPQLTPMSKAGIAARWAAASVTSIVLFCILYFPIAQE